MPSVTRSPDLKRFQRVKPILFLAAFWRPGSLDCLLIVEVRGFVEVERGGHKGGWGFGGRRSSVRGRAITDETEEVRRLCASDGLADQGDTPVLVPALVSLPRTHAH